jgi:anti-sigma factor RsiW
VNCRGVIQELSSYLDGELDAAGLVELDQHLQRCGKCRMVVDTCRKTIQIFCDAEPVPLPEDFRARLHAALERRLGRKPIA